MESIHVKLRADNSSGHQELHLSNDGDEFWFTLTGRYEDKPIQIDFDTLTICELEDMKTTIELIINC